MFMKYNSMGGNIVQVFLFFLHKKNMALAIFEISPLCTVPARGVACTLLILLKVFGVAAVTGINA